MLKFPGEVYFFPPSSGEDDHPHVLLTPSGQDGGFVTLAYSSSKPTEKQNGAAAVLVDPSRRGRISSGFDRPTYVYPARLISLYEESLPESSGRIIDDLADVKTALRQALGLGTGTGATRGPAAGTLRGQIVTLETATAKDIGTKFALVVTEPRYGWEERYQLIIPIYELEEVVPVEFDLALEATPWLRQIGMTGREVVLAISQVQAVWHRDEIKDQVGAVIEASTMTTVELALERWFDI